MLRFTRPLLQQVTKATTGLTGIPVHPDPLPELARVYESTLTVLQKFPETSVYRQGATALIQHKLNIIQRANGAVADVEKQLDEGQIEESLIMAKDEQQLATKMLEWKSWEPLEEKPPTGQWDYSNS